MIIVLYGSMCSVEDTNYRDDIMISLGLEREETVMAVASAVPVFACCACCSCCCLCCSSSIDTLLVFWTGWGVSPEPYGIMGLNIDMPGVMEPCTNNTTTE